MGTCPKIFDKVILSTGSGAVGRIVLHISARLLLGAMVEQVTE